MAKEGKARSNGGHPAWYRIDSDEALEHLESNRNGLSADEAEERLEDHGANSIRTEQKVSAWQVLVDQFTSPMIYVLIVALIVTLMIQSWGDAVVIGLVLIINATIGFIQEYRAESAVQSLMEMVSPKATVRRGGSEQQIDGEDLVPGDIVLLEQGEMVPADLRLREARGLQVNESALTGESVPVNKIEDALKKAEENLPPADQKNMAFMGTAVTSGSGEGIVIATGAGTQLGVIAEEIRGAGETETPLQRRMDRLAKWIAAVIVVIAAIAFGIGLMMGRSVTQMFLLAVSLSVAAIPAGLPVVMTVALAVGVRRMARRHAVIRHLPAVETLGSCTAIVSDKTGTLTQNRMTVQKIVAGDRAYEITGEARTFKGEVRTQRGDENGAQETADLSEGSPLHFTLLSGLLNNSAEFTDRCSADGGEEDDESESKKAKANDDSQQEAEDEQSREGQSQGEREAQGDPMEVALLFAASKAGFSRDDLLEQYPVVDKIPFRTEERFSATIHDVSDQRDDGPLVLIKGAPERIAEMSDSAMQADGERGELDRQWIDDVNHELASQGLRVLAFAIGRGRQAAEDIRAESPSGMTFVGMVGLRDPARPEAVEAVDNCHRAGIRVIMVTGDHASTAAAIAHQVHLDRPPHAGREPDEVVQQKRDGGKSEDVPGEKSEVDSAEQSTADQLPEAHTGQEIATYSDEELDEVLERTNVFARVKPDHKVRIVNRLKNRRQIVAVTGDGVNDAPALKSAHLGSAMGQTGTDVAKEASDMVITDDNFASVYSAVEEGRTAFRNIRMATFFLLSTGAADVLIILMSLALRWPLPLLPAQILWCNVVTNGIADVALGFEPGEEALYRRAPRPMDEGVLDGALIERLAVVAVWLAIGVLGIFYWVVTQSGSVDLARVSALTTLVLFQKVHVFNCRSEDVSIFKKSLFSNKILFGGVLASLLVHIAALYIPWTQRLLNFQPLPWQIWIASIGVAATAIIVNELHKWLRPRDKVNRQTQWMTSLLRRLSGGQREQLPKEIRKQLDRIEDTAEENRQLLADINEPRRGRDLEKETAKSGTRKQ